MQAGTLRQLSPQDPAAADEMVVELREELRGAISDIRRLVYDLRHPALDDLGLAGALRRLAERYGSDDQLLVSVEAPEELPTLPAAVEVAVYRIAQETLINVARHAKANSGVVRLSVNRHVTLEVVDDGVGIPTGRNAGVGLSSMRDRLRAWRQLRRAVRTRRRYPRACPSSPGQRMTELDLLRILFAEDHPRARLLLQTRPRSSPPSPTASARSSTSSPRATPTPRSPDDSL